MIPSRRAVLIDMAYELGEAGLSQFTHFLAAVRRGDWSGASRELGNSKLASQAPHRVAENQYILETGFCPVGVSDEFGLIRRHEGCVLVAKPDTPPNWVIGWGRDIQPTWLTPGFDGVVASCTQAEADAWLAEDVAKATAWARRDLGEEYW